MNLTRRIFAGTVLLAGVLGCNHSPSTDFQHGVAFFRNENYSKAEACFERVVSAGNQTAQIWNFLGVCRLHTGKPENAMAAFQAALKLDAGHLAAQYNLAAAHLEANHPDQAIPLLRALTQTGNSPAVVYHQLARAYLRAGNWQQAKAVLSKIPGVDANPDLQNMLGIVEAHLGNTKLARQHFETVLRLDPQYRDASLNLAILEHYFGGQKQAALAQYQKFRESQPKSQPREDINLTIAQLERELAPRPKAVEPRPEPVKPVEPTPTPTPPEPPTQPKPLAVVTPEPKPVTPPKPVSPPPSTVKRRTRLQIGALTTGDRTKARTHFNEGVVLHRQGKLPQAIASYSKAVAADAAYAQAYYNLAIAYLASQQSSKALDNYELAIAANPDFADARNNYAILLQQEGYITDALIEYEKLLEKNPNDTSVRLTVATLYARDPATKDKARQQYLAYLKQAPNSPASRSIRDWLEKNP